MNKFQTKIFGCIFTEVLTFLENFGRLRKICICSLRCFDYVKVLLQVLKGILITLFYLSCWNKDMSFSNAVMSISLLLYIVALLVHSFLVKTV